MTKKVERTVALAEMVERLALAACGARLWPNPYAREYHRGAVERILAAMTPHDLQTIKNGFPK